MPSTFALLLVMLPLSFPNGLIVELTLLRVLPLLLRMALALLRDLFQQAPTLLLFEVFPVQVINIATLFVLQVLKRASVVLKLTAGGSKSLFDIHHLPFIAAKLFLALLLHLPLQPRSVGL